MTAISILRRAADAQGDWEALIANDARHADVHFALSVASFLSKGI